MKLECCRSGLPYNSCGSCHLYTLRFWHWEAENINMRTYIIAAMTILYSFLKKGHFLLALLMVIILLAGCSLTQTNQIKGNTSTSECACMSVNGSVLGKIKDNTTVVLYKAEGFDYKLITGKINEAHPDRMAKVSANQSFFFHCLPEGHYLLNIPESSYDFSFGSPIPAESTQGNLKVAVILQGGNSQNLFGAFSVERIS